ncbi:hypothetical protein [Micromonospora zhanjiangensis]|uniref:Uncharacterized protein n=1 Tax=Micromonospora zhanjiangensis TaxID=1522057 RepID=A0ABV8KXD6_9ACTN
MTSAARGSSSQNAVALNDTTDLTQLLLNGGLLGLLSQSTARNAGCGTDCDCNDYKCGCRGVVEDLRMLPSELEKVRKERVEQLRQQLEEAEQHLAEFHSPPRGTSGSGDSS